MNFELKFEDIKKLYDNGLWTLSLVKVAVRKAIITKDQYKEITGKEY